MIDATRAREIAQEWLDAWNAHDPERVVAHFAENVIVVSPLVEQLRPKSKPTGVLGGKKEVLEYYKEGLAAAGDLHFELVDVFTGPTEVVILYRNHRGILVTESLEFDGDEVVIVRVAHGTQP